MRPFFSGLRTAAIIILVFLAAAIAWGLFMGAGMAGLCWLWGGCM